MTRETVLGKESSLKYESGNGRLAVATSMIIAVIYAVMEWLTPFQFDNIVFDAVYLEFSGGSSDFSLDAYLQYINHIRQEDNWRMANILAPASTLILNNKPLFSALCGLCVGLSAWLGARFASGGKRPGFGALVASEVLSVNFLSLHRLIWEGRIISLILLTCLDGSIIKRLQ